MIMNVNVSLNEMKKCITIRQGGTILCRVSHIPLCLFHMIQFDPEKSYLQKRYLKEDPQSDAESLEEPKAQKNRGRNKSLESRKVKGEIDAV